jgi:hypothetical protein
MCGHLAVQQHGWLFRRTYPQFRASSLCCPGPATDRRLRGLLPLASAIARTEQVIFQAHGRSRRRSGCSPSARNVAKQVTNDPKGNTGSGPQLRYFAVTRHGNMWANVNRSGHDNETIHIPGLLRPRVPVMAMAFGALIWFTSQFSHKARRTGAAKDRQDADDTRTHHGGGAKAGPPNPVSSRTGGGASHAPTARLRGQRTAELGVAFADAFAD